jgi:hypothetical protein
MSGKTLSISRKNLSLLPEVYETDRIQLERESIAYNAFQEATKRGRKAEA